MKISKPTIDRIRGEDFFLKASGDKFWQVV
jgi:hypothetical protein